VRSTTRSPETVDIFSYASVVDAVRAWQPSAVFYLAAEHGSSENRSAEGDSTLFRKSLRVHVEGVVNFLEALATSASDSSLFYAASSHIFGSPDVDVQDENTPFKPDSVYAITKTTGVHACRYYRMYRNVRASSGILYNHESPLRQGEFISQKIARAAVAISRGNGTELVVGDLAATVDWGYAPDFVDAMVRIAESAPADEYVIATGEPHSVREFVEIAFSHVGLDWQEHVREDRSVLTRGSRARLGNSARLRERTGWQPSLSFSDMVRRLVDAARNRNES
jgi:GDPmannose 4,6-dehydratase